MPATFVSRPAGSGLALSAAAGRTTFLIVWAPLRSWPPTAASTESAVTPSAPTTKPRRLAPGRAPRSAPRSAPRPAPRSASPEAPARRASQTSVATPATMAARAGSASTGRAAGRSSAAAPASPVSSTMRPTASGIRRRASRPATAARTSVTTRTEPCRISLSLVPKVAIAHSLTGVGVRSMTVDPMASTGDDAGARKPATRWPAAIPATAARIPLRASRRRIMPRASARGGGPDCPAPSTGVREERRDPGC